MDADEVRNAIRRAMDAGTARDYIDDLRVERALLMAEIDQLQELVRQLKADLKREEERSQQYANDYLRWRAALEAERDQWQRQAVNNG